MPLGLVPLELPELLGSGYPLLPIPDEPEEPLLLSPVAPELVDPPELSEPPGLDAPDDPLPLIPDVPEELESPLLIEEESVLLPEESLLPELPLPVEYGFFFVLLSSVDVVPDEPEESVVPDMLVLSDVPVELVIPLLPDASGELVLPLVVALWATAMPVPSAETRTAIKSFFMSYLHR